MASLLSPRRTTAGLSLQASDAGPKPPEMAVETGDGPPVGWPVAAIAGGLVSALVGWVLCAGLAVVGWLAADPGTLANALGVGTQFWLLANGVSVSLEGLVVTLVPWGATAVAAYMMAWSAGFAARRIRSDQLAGPFTVAGVLLATYLVPVLGIGAWQGQPWRDPLHWAAVILVSVWPPSGAPAAPWGGGSPDGWPDWARALPRAVLGAQLVLLAFAAALLVTSLIRHLDRVTALHAALDPGVAGGIALLAAQLAVVPNVLAGRLRTPWAPASRWARVRVVAPAATELGILPGLPLLGCAAGGRAGQPAAVALAGLGGARWSPGGGPGRPVTARACGSTPAAWSVGLAAVLAALVFVGSAGRPAATSG
jgi:hypothetical protein